MAYHTVSTANGICADCWCFFSRRKSTKMRCDECDAIHVRERARLNAIKSRARRGMTTFDSDIKCLGCSVTFKRGSIGTRYCEDCREIRATKLIGNPMSCGVCEVSFTRTASNQLHCKDCAVELRRIRGIEKNKRTDHAAEYERTKEKRKAHQSSPRGREVRNAKNQKRRSNPKEQLRDRMASYIRISLQGKGGRSWESMVGYTKEELATHIERQFLPGMSWETFGPDIHIDHILPVSSFNYETADDPEFKACWALTNLRPLWAVDNVKKSDKVLYLL